MIKRFLAFCMLFWLFGFLWFALFLPRAADPDAMTDGIVVLTGSAGRIERGLDMLKHRRGEELLVSGVDRDVKPREFAKAYNVPSDLMKCCVTLGREAIDTRSNAVEANAWLDRRHYKTIRLVTADWHMRRARYELSQHLQEPVAITTDAVQTKPSLAVLLREYNKYMLRRVAGLFGI
ncbi:MAG: YdcF family protein [Sphingobium sp.]|nr:YdcF family protein [Sphingobium sp.]